MEKNNDQGMFDGLTTLEIEQIKANLERWALRLQSVFGNGVLQVLKGFKKKEIMGIQDSPTIKILLITKIREMLRTTAVPSNLVNEYHNIQESTSKFSDYEEGLKWFKNIVSPIILMQKPVDFIKNLEDSFSRFFKTSSTQQNFKEKLVDCKEFVQNNKIYIVSVNINIECVKQEGFWPWSQDEFITKISNSCIQYLVLDNTNELLLFWIEEVTKVIKNSAKPKL